MLPGLATLSHKSRVELESVRNGVVVFVDSKPLAYRRDRELVPVLVNLATIDRLPRIVVDMGAVPHVVGGADVMAPGVRRVDGEFPADHLLVVVDEKYGKHLAIGRALVDSKAMAGVKKGKVVRNLHFVGDPVWDIVKGSS